IAWFATNPRSIAFFEKCSQADRNTSSRKSQSITGSPGAHRGVVRPGRYRLPVLKDRLAFLDEGLHALLLVFCGKKRMEVAPFIHQGFGERTFIRRINAFLGHD